MIILWFIIWAIADTYDYPENVDILHMNGWAMTLVLALGIDLIWSWTSS